MERPADVMAYRSRSRPTRQGFVVPPRRGFTTHGEDVAAKHKPEGLTLL